MDFAYKISKNLNQTVSVKSLTFGHFIVGCSKKTLSQKVTEIKIYILDPVSWPHLVECPKLNIFLRFALACVLRTATISKIIPHLEGKLKNDIKLGNKRRRKNSKKFYAKIFIISINVKYKEK